MLSLKVEVCSGSIQDAAVDAVKLAERLGIGMWLNFNGVELWVIPGMSPEQVVARWDDLAGRQRQGGKW